MNLAPNHLNSSRRRLVTGALFSVLAFAVLYPLSQLDFLLFHSLIEIFTVMVAFGIFVISWNTRRITGNRYLAVLGTGFLFVGLATTLHALAYKGMGVFQSAGANLPTQLWIVSRGFLAAAFILAGMTLWRDLSPGWTLAGFGAAFVVALSAVFWGVFPAMYVDGAGLTPLKIGLEFVVMALLAVSAYLVWIGRRRFASHVSDTLMVAIGLMIATEFVFTTYVTVYDFPSFLAHYLALLAFSFVYLGIIDTALRQPYGLLFHELQERERAEHEIADTLQSAILTAPDQVASIQIGQAFVSATSSARVGGDFYDLFSTSGLVAFVIGDVCGKGIAAAAATTMVRTTLRAFAYDDPDPAEVLRHTNEAVAQQLPDDRFVTVVYGVIDPSTGQSCAGSAGHPDPVLRDAAGSRFIELPSNPPLGVVTDRTFAVAEFRVDPKDTIVLFTDGLVDAGWHVGAFGMERIAAAVARMSPEPNTIAAQLLSAAVDHAGASLSDDAAVVALQYSPSGLDSSGMM
jgi:Membrane-associated sensor domain/Stage II sporulation protein E (SpoIIE)